MSRLTESAQGEEYCLRLYPYCNCNTETTVLAHINCIDKGTSKKSPDWWAVYACSTCHDIIDGKNINHALSKSEITECILRAIYLTQKRMIEKGLIRI